jgi:hypothetical protein
MLHTFSEVWVSRHTSQLNRKGIVLSDHERLLLTSTEGREDETGVRSLSNCVHATDHEVV